MTQADNTARKQRKATTPDNTGEKQALQIAMRPGITEGHAMAEPVMLPKVRNAATALNFGSHLYGGQSATSINDGISVVEMAVEETRNGELGGMSDILTAQALSLDAMFTNLASRSLSNMAQFPDAGERYMRLALKAQANCRSTIEALTKLARGGEQVVRHIHVDNRGGQAVIAENIHTGGLNARSDGQPQAPALDAVGPSLLGSDTLGQALPGTGNAEWQMQDARRPITRST